MNSNTISPKKSATTIFHKPYSTSMLTSKDVEENEELTASEQAWLERWEEKHLAYSDYDLHY